MPTATLSLQWQLGRYQSKTGWCIKVYGKNITRNVKLSSMGFVEADSPPYRNHNPKLGTGPECWVMSPTEEKSFGFEKGRGHASPREPPIGYVTEYLEILESKGYKVVGTQSQNVGEHNKFPSWLWTLQTQ